MVQGTVGRVNRESPRLLYLKSSALWHLRANAINVARAAGAGAIECVHQLCSSSHCAT